MARSGLALIYRPCSVCVLAIGIVVDDAIVIVEAVSHYIERGMSAQTAAVKRWEINRPVIGIRLCLMAVFSPRPFCRASRQDARPVCHGDRRAASSVHQCGDFEATNVLSGCDQPCPDERNFLSGFNAVYNRFGDCL